VRGQDLADVGGLHEEHRIGRQQEGMQRQT
jgi:hypothetical protein